MSYTVKDLVPDRIAPVNVNRTLALDHALGLMLLHDYSQLPVVEEGQLIGMLTSDSALQALKTLGVSTAQLHVSDAMTEAVTVNANDDVFDLLRLLRDSAAVVVVDDDERVLTIVTPYDTTDFFRRRAEDWMFIEDIEKGLRDAVTRAWKVSNDRPIPDRLAAAIRDVTSDRDAEVRFRRALGRYLGIAGNGPMQVEKAHAAYDEVFGKGSIPSLDALSFMQWAELMLRDECWNAYASKILLSRDTVRSMLKEVAKVRNALAHFRGGISEDQRRSLAYCAEWLDRHLGGDCEPASADSQAGAPRSPGRVSRYAVLAEHLRGLADGSDVFEVSFSQLEAVLGHPLPESARKHRSWWANDSVSHSHSQEWLKAGFRVDSVSVQNASVRFARTRDEGASKA